MLLYTAVVDVIAKTATLFSAAHLLDRVLTRLGELSWTVRGFDFIHITDIVMVRPSTAVILPVGAGIA